MAAVVDAAPHALPGPAPDAADRPRERISTARRFDPFFVTYGADEAGTAPLVAALRAKLESRINGSVLANLDAGGKVFVSFSEKDRSADADFWRSVAPPLAAAGARDPEVLSQALAALPADQRETFEAQLKAAGVM